MSQTGQQLPAGNQLHSDKRRTRVQTSIVQHMAAVVIGALLLGACGASDDPTAGDAGPIEISSGEIELDRADIAAREKAWIAARPAAYSYEVETECECFLAGTYSVTVDGDEVLSVESYQPDAEPYRVYSPPILDAAFAMLDEPLALSESGEIPDGQASAAFDPTFTYPVSWTVTGSDGLPSFHVEVRNFTQLDPAVIDRPPPGVMLVISNQSYEDPDVEVTVTLDGEVVIDRSFAVEGQHTFTSYRLPLAAGEHELAVMADTGATHERVLTLGSEQRHVYVGFTSGGGAGSSGAFEVSESDEPFGFG